MYRFIFIGFFLSIPFWSGVCWSKNTAAVGEEQATAEAWADLGNWQRAVVHYGKAVELDPRNAGIRLRLAEGLQRIGRLDEALSELSKAKKLQGESVQVHSRLGALFLDRQEASKACAAFSHALKLDPIHARSLFGQGQCQQSLFESTKKKNHKLLAIAAYRAYLKHHAAGPHHLPARTELQKLEYGSLGQAMADAKTSLSQGKFRLAAQTLERVVAQKPDLQEAHHLRALALASPAMGRIDEAAESWEKAPDIKEARLELGIYKFEEDELEESMEHLGAAIRLDPNFADPHYHMGLVCMELQNARHLPAGMDRKALGDKAVAAFKRVAVLAPRSALASRAKSKLQLLTGKIYALNEGEVIDSASELELGRKITGEIEERFGLVQDVDLIMRLNKILERISLHSERLPGVMPYKVRVLNVDGINALSFTGGTIYIYKGLIDFVRRELNDSDDALAFVIGHEVVHVDRRHGLGMLDLVGGAQQLMEGRSLNVRSLNTLMKGMTRKHEFEADKIGALFALRAGFDPAAAYRFHRRMLASGHEVPEGLDHPTHAERAEQMKEYLLGLRAKARHFDMGLTALDAQRFAEAVRHLEIFLGLFPNNIQARNNLGVAKFRLAMQDSVPLHQYKISSDIDPRSRAPKIQVRDEKSGAFSPEKIRMIEAQGLFESLVRKDPTYQRGQLNLGAASLALGQNDKALLAFGAALTLKSTAEVENNLAVAQLVSGDIRAGEEMLKKILKVYPAFADAHYNMARLKQKQKSSAQAREHFLAYLKLDDKSGWAEASRRALKELP